MSEGAHIVETGIDVVNLHADLVGIPSLSRSEGKIADYLEDYLFGHGIPVERIDDNIIFCFGAGERMLLLSSHLDVVPPSPDHPYDPFKATQLDGKIYGRGAVDAKASVSAMITSVLTLAAEDWMPPNGKIIVALTVCEELGGWDNGLELILPRLNKPDAAIVGEPTMMEPCVAEKGVLILKLTARGKAAHAARPHLGDNAIEIMADDLVRLRDLTFDRVHPYLGETTLTVTTIEGGSARNVIPETCTAYLDIRSTPEYDHEEITRFVTDAVQSEVSVHSKRLVPVDTNQNEAIVLACLDANPAGVLFGSPTVSDWVFLQGTQTVKMGPGDSHLSHTADEHIEIDELRRGEVIYRKTIQAFFEGGK